MKLPVSNVKYLMVAVLLSCTATIMAQQDSLALGVASVPPIAGEPRAAGDSLAVALAPVKPVPLWKQKLYYGYNFDIYFHHDSRSDRKENGWSIALEPEIGWRLKERLYLGLRVGGSYANMVSQFDISELDTTYSTNLRVHQGSWEVTPYVRYRLKSLFNGKVGIWLEAHVYTGMSFPRVSDGEIKRTDYDGLKYSCTYGVQVSPVITYQFNKKSTFQIFFSILSLGYSGTAFCYNGKKTEYTNDVIIFSGKLRNLIANHFTPGLYGLKFGVQKSF